MLHDDYLCLVESGKQQIKEVRRKFKRKTWKQRQLLSESGFVLRIAPPSLSRDRRIKMKKSINQSILVKSELGNCSIAKKLCCNLSTSIVRPKKKINKMTVSCKLQPTMNKRQKKRAEQNKSKRSKSSIFWHNGTF